MRRRSELNIPDWARKIEDMRHGRNLSQEGFGSRLGVSAMAVSRWERGAAEPTGETYIRLGNLAEAPLCWFFWKRAGLRLSDVTRVLPDAHQRFSENRIFDVQFVKAGSKRKPSLNKASLVVIPLLPGHAGTPGAPGDTSDLTDISMSPLILDGYIVAVDTAATENNDLVGQIVIAWHREKGLLVSRLIRFDHMDALVSDRREYEAVSLTAGSDWRIVGKVLWWTGKAR